MASLLRSLLTLFLREQLKRAALASFIGLMSWGIAARAQAPQFLRGAEDDFDARAWQTLTNAWPTADAVPYFVNWADPALQASLNAYAQAAFAQAQHPPQSQEWQANAASSYAAWWTYANAFSPLVPMQLFFAAARMAPPTPPESCYRCGTSPYLTDSATHATLAAFQAQEGARPQALPQTEWQVRSPLLSLPNRTPRAPELEDLEPAAPIDGTKMASRFWQLARHAPGLNPQAALRTYRFLESRWLELSNRRYVTVLDYSQPSSQKRMYVFDLQEGRVDQYPVAHGAPPEMRSHAFDPLMAPGHSDRDGSNLTPTGAHVTALRTDSSRRVGFRLVLDGVEAKNGNSRSRGIVMHGNRDWADDKAFAENGYVKRSEGCPVIDTDLSRRLLPALAGKSLVYFYGNEA